MAGAVMTGGLASAALAGAAAAAPSAPGRVLVTGAASGIGAAIAVALHAAGWSVVGMDRSPSPTRDRVPGGGTDGLAAHRVSKDSAADVAAHQFSKGTAADLAAHQASKGAAVDLAEHYVQVDLTDDLALRAALRRVGAVDAVVHAAGFMRTAPLGRLDPADSEAMWRIHVRAAEVLVDALAPTLPDGARIVLVGSRTANGAAGRSQYAATKAALAGLARSWAAELASRGITVNIIAPGATDTPMLRDPARGGTPPRLPPMGRFVRPDEIGAVAAFLLGPGAGAITGQQIVVCGGASL